MVVQLECTRVNKVYCAGHAKKSGRWSLLICIDLLLQLKNFIGAVVIFLELNSDGGISACTFLFFFLRIFCDIIILKTLKLICNHNVLRQIESTEPLCNTKRTLLHTPLLLVKSWTCILNVSSLSPSSPGESYNIARS